MLVTTKSEAKQLYGNLVISNRFNGLVESFYFILNNFHPFTRLSCAESTCDSCGYPIPHVFQLIAPPIGRHQNKTGNLLHAAPFFPALFLDHVYSK